MQGVKTDLWDEITLEGHIPTSPVRQRGGGDVGQSLCFVDHGVSKVQNLPVFQLHLTTPDHLVQLLLDLRCKRPKVRLFFLFCLLSTVKQKAPTLYFRALGHEKEPPSQC